MSDIFEEVELLTITYKSSHIIDQCLSKISEKFSITVVENSNDNDFKKKIEDRKNVKCILSGENLGFGKAFNLGAKSINNKYILHFNPDALINDDVIYKLYELAKGKNFGIISAIESEENTSINTTETNELKEVESVKGFVMFINNHECKETNYFDENFFLYLEEIDLCKRLRKNGKKIYLDKNIIIHHLGGKSHNKSIEFEMELSRNWHWMWSSFYYHKKHYGYINALLKMSPKLLSSLIKFIFYLLIFQKFKSDIYKHRVFGIINSVLLKKSWYRPSI